MKIVGANHAGDYTHRNSATLAASSAAIAAATSAVAVADTAALNVDDAAASDAAAAAASDAAAAAAAASTANVAADNAPFNMKIVCSCRCCISCRTVAGIAAVAAVSTAPQCTVEAPNPGEPGIAVSFATLSQADAPGIGVGSGTASGLEPRPSTGAAAAAPAFVNAVPEAVPAGAAAAVRHGSFTTGPKSLMIEGTVEEGVVEEGFVVSGPVSIRPQTFTRLSQHPKSQALHVIARQWRARRKAGRIAD